MKVDNLTAVYLEILKIISTKKLVLIEYLIKIWSLLTTENSVYTFSLKHLKKYYLRILTNKNRLRNIK